MQVKTGLSIREIEKLILLVKQNQRDTMKKLGKMSFARIEYGMLKNEVIESAQLLAILNRMLDEI